MTIARMVALFVLAGVLVVPAAFAQEKPRPVRVSAEIFNRDDIPAEIYIAAKEAGHIFSRTAARRAAALADVVKVEGLIRQLLDHPDTQVQDLLGALEAYTVIFERARTEGDRELVEADHRVIVVYRQWFHVRGFQITEESAKAYAEWARGALASHFLGRYKQNPFALFEELSTKAEQLIDAAAAEAHRRQSRPAGR